MTSERMQRAYELFEQALDRSPEQRDVFLAKACGGDAQLRGEIELLLQHDSQVPDDFMGLPEADTTLRESPPAPGHDPLIGSRVGNFVVKAVIGSGGMGTVYAAAQDQPHRTVALKIIKLGMDTAEVLARFDLEREALALMHHPNIAQVFHAGATEQGRPYFAMEYVAGVPITDHCDRHQLDIRQRLGLFMQVCAAVQHAHQKGIIHRDLKPSNILVEEAEGTAAPKIIDFGVAKALNRRLGARTVFTAQWQIIGTPEYMSPEQAEMSGQDIDTRTDIYSLGVLLYELLTGALPFDSSTLRREAFVEIQRIIREVEPEKPSTKLSSLSQEATMDRRCKGPSDPEAQVRDPGRAHPSPRHSSSLDNVARNRRSDPRTLARDLRGDLDWIVMKCLEKDRTRRYETAGALVEDIQRHLMHEPVQAGPPSAAYRVRKFVRRNRGPALAVALLALSLVAGMAGTTTFALREARERKLAEDNARRAEDQEALALKRAAETRQVAEFQASMLSGIDAEQMGPRIFLDIRNQLRAGLERTWVPGDNGRVRKRTADEVAAGLARFDEAAGPANRADVVRRVWDVTMLAPAVEAIENGFTEQPQVQAQLLDTIGRAYLSLGLYDAADPVLHQALELRRRVLGEEHPETLDSINNVGTLFRSKGEYKEALPHYQMALERRRRVLGDDHPDTLTSISNMGALLWSMGRYAEAEPFCHEMLNGRRRVLGENHPDTLHAVSNMGALLYQTGRYEEAEACFQEACERRRQILGDDHLDTLISINNLGGVLSAMGRYQEAEPLLRDALERKRRVLGNDHPETLNSLTSVGALLHQTSKPDEASTAFMEALAASRRVFGDDHANTLRLLSNLGVLREAVGDLDAAETYSREAFEGRRRVLGDEHQSTLISMDNMGLLYQRMGRYDEAERYHREALEGKWRVLGAEHADTLTSMNNLGHLLQLVGRYAEAEPFLRQALEGRRRVLGDDHPHTLLSLRNLAQLLIATGWFEEAKSLALQAHTLCASRFGPGHTETGKAVDLIIRLHEAWHATDPNKGHDTKAAEWRDKLEQEQATAQTARPARSEQQ